MISILWFLFIVLFPFLIIWIAQAESNRLEDEKKEAIEERRNKEQEFARVYWYNTGQYYKALKQSDDFADALERKFNKYKF